MWSIFCSQKSRFQASKRTKMGSAIQEGGRPANFHEFCFQAAKRSDLECVQLQVGRFSHAQ